MTVQLRLARSISRRNAKIRASAVPLQTVVEWRARDEQVVDQHRDVANSDISRRWFGTARLVDIGLSVAG